MWIQTAFDALPKQHVDAPSFVTGCGTVLPQFGAIPFTLLAQKFTAIVVTTMEWPAEDGPSKLAHSRLRLLIHWSSATMATLLDHRFATVPPPPSIEETQVENVLDSSHQGYFYRAIRDILHTCIAETTFAQIIDGLPLKSVAHATAGLSWESSLNNDENLCAGSLEMLNGFRGRFEPLKMKLSLETLRRYQKTPPGSSEWTLPLIELVAVAIHRIVVLLYKAKNPDIHSCIRMDRICSTTACGKTTFHPTPFCLPQYGNPNQYPEGVAELPRYWAEDRIFGGVVISGRGESGVEVSFEAASMQTKQDS